MRKMAVCMAVVLLSICFIACGAVMQKEDSPASQIEQNGSASIETKDSTEKSEPVRFMQKELPNRSNQNKEEKTMKISVKSSGYEIIYELNHSRAAKELYAQLPLKLEAKPFSDNEMTFYPSKKLNVTGTPLSDGKLGSLSYYAPWGDVVMFYAPCSPNGSLYELGAVISGKDDIAKLNGTIRVEAHNE